MDCHTKHDGLFVCGVLMLEMPACALKLKRPLPQALDASLRLKVKASSVTADVCTAPNAIAAPALRLVEMALAPPSPVPPPVPRPTGIVSSWLPVERIARGTLQKKKKQDEGLQTTSDRSWFEAEQRLKNG